jgi:lipopolysaccharide/colanic/teichoic acid biosynthesis glycosyltransferase/glycosyltransferase involved in cell wall biosynthesis
MADQAADDRSEISKRLDARIRIVHAVTSSESARVLMRGQLGWLAQHGYDLTVLCGPGPDLDDVERREGVAIETLPLEREISLARDLRALFGIYRALRRIRPRLINASTPKAGLLGGIAAWFAGVPVRLYTLRGLRLETTSGPKRKLLWTMEWLASRAAQRVICVSESLRQLYVDQGCTTCEKTLVIGNGSSNGVDAPRFEAIANDKIPIAAQHKAELQIPTDAHVVGFVDRLTRDKGVTELLQAFEILQTTHPDLYLVIVGDFESGDPVPDSIVRGLRSNARVRITGFVPDPGRYYALFDVLLYPSHREGFPNVPLEAAAAALPVVAFAATGTKGAVVDGVTGTLVPPGDITGLAAAVSKYLSDPALRSAVGLGAQSHVKSSFHPQALWAGLHALYGESLEMASVQSGFPFLLKRTLDCTIAGSALLLSLPILAPTAAAIRLTMGSPVFFRQERPGLFGKPFTVIKLRTMTTAPENSVASDSKRLTRLGGVIRNLSLDELPQLWNVIRGDMSLVGPRPLLMQYLSRYSREQARRHAVLPGITGWAQVHGRNEIDWRKRLALDVDYVDNWSLMLDLKILTKTLAVVLKRQGITRSGHATMPEFMGTGEENERR